MADRAGAKGDKHPTPVTRRCFFAQSNALAGFFYSSIRKGSRQVMANVYKSRNTIKKTVRSWLDSFAAPQPQARAADSDSARTSARLLVRRRQAHGVRPDLTAVRCGKASLTAR